MMEIQCPSCRETCSVEFTPAIGQHVICPFCKVKFSYAGAEGGGDEAIVCDASARTIMAVCPFCGFGESVEEECAGQVGVCSHCRGEFTIMPNARGIPFVQLAQSANQRQEVPAPAVPSRGMGCLGIVLISVAITTSAMNLNYGAVAIASGLMLLAVLILLRNLLIERSGRTVSFSQMVNRFGGAWVISVAYAVLFLLFSLGMKSCQKSIQESDRRSAIREAQIKKDGGYWVSKKCPDCHYEMEIWKDLKQDGSYSPMYNGCLLLPSPSDMRYHIRCDNCGRYVDLGHYL